MTSLQHISAPNLRISSHRRVSAVAVSISLFALLATWLPESSFVSTQPSRCVQRRHSTSFLARKKDDENYGEMVFEDLFDGDSGEEEPRARSFRSSRNPRRIRAEEGSMTPEEEWGGTWSTEEETEETQEEVMEEDESEVEDRIPEVSDAEVDEFLAELAARPIVVRQDDTVPLDPFGRDASLELDTFKELRSAPERGLMYARGLPDQQMMLTLKDRVGMLTQHAEAGEWQEARYIMRGIWRKRRLRLPLGRFLWNLMIKAHANAGRPKAAESWVIDMLDRVYQPDIISYNTLLNVFGKVGDFLSAEKWLRRMRARGVEPDMYSYGALAAAYGKKGDLEGVQRTITTMRKAGVKIFASNTFLDNIVLKLCAEQGKDIVAKSWFNEMRMHGTMPDAVSYLHMIKALAQAGDLESAAEMLMQMQEARLEPRRQHFHAVMSGHARASDLEGAEAWLRVMIDAGHRPDSYTYNILMSAVAQGGATEAAEGIMFRMQENQIRPDLVTYSTLIGAFAEAANVTGARFWLFQAERDGFEPDLKCYNQAIKACARAGNSTMASQLARRLLRNRLTPDPYTYNTLLSSFAKDGNWKDAEFWVDHMQRAARWRYNEFPVKQVAMAYSEVLLAHVRSGNLEAAEAWLAQMLGEGVEPDSRCYSALARANQQLGNLKEARKWAVRMATWSNYRTPSDLLDLLGEDQGRSIADTSALESEVVNQVH